MRSESSSGLDSMIVGGIPRLEGVSEGCFLTRDLSKCSGLVNYYLGSKCTLHVSPSAPGQLAVVPWFSAGPQCLPRARLGAVDREHGVVLGPE